MRFFRGFMAIKSLVIGAAILALWARSMWFGDAIRKGNATQYVQLGSAAGCVIVTFAHDGERTTFAGDWDYLATREPRAMIQEAGIADSLWNRVGFGYQYDLQEVPSREATVNVTIPHWFAFLLAMPSAFLWLIRWSRRYPSIQEIRDTTYECPTCGQMFPRVPKACPVCGQPLVAPEAM